MKRCPECLFIYPESDSRCDFDNTPLVAVDEAEIESATTPAPAPAKKKRAASSKKRPAAESTKRSGGSKKGSRKKVTAITAAVGLMLSLGGFFTYSSLNSRADDLAQIPPVVSEDIAAPAAPIVPHVDVATSPLNAAPAEPSPTPAPKTAVERTATSHSRTTAAPVSTSGPGIGKKLGGKPVILLTTGGKIDADEVWRTRDGVWYRRAGIVTLLKHNRVKAIVNQ